MSPQMVIVRVLSGRAYTAPTLTEGGGVTTMRFGKSTATVPGHTTNAEDQVDSFMATGTGPMSATRLNDLSKSDVAVAKGTGLITVI